MANCEKCGHQHQGADLTFICIGCACLERPVRATEAGPGQPVHESTCKRCGKPCLSWQVFCGAGCSARWEAGDRGPQLRGVREGS
jgi:hypothetical protein